MHKACMRCGQVQAASKEQCSGCGAFFTDANWSMTPARIKRVHVVALRKKGLSREEYEMRLNAAGVKSCKEFTQLQFEGFMQSLIRLPDAPATAQK